MQAGRKYKKIGTLSKRIKFVHTSKIIAVENVVNGSYVFHISTEKSFEKDSSDIWHKNLT